MQVTGFWESIVGYFKRERKSGVSTGTLRTGAAPLFVYNDNTAMCVATVFRCVKLLSESVANLPIQHLKRKDGIFVDAGNARMDYLLNVQPDYMINAFDFWRQVVQELLADGNAYIVPVYNKSSMELERLALCERGTVTHDTVNDRYDIYDLNNGISGRYSENEIIHIKGQTLRNSKRGVSVLTYARLTMGIAAAGDKETHERFANGGNMRAIVSNDRSTRGIGVYSDDQLEKAATDLSELMNGGNRFLSVPGQVQVSPFTLTSSDMQFLESRKFTVREICRFFGVHPSFVFDDTSNNYKSAEQANVAFLSHTLNPLLRNIEIELRRKLISPSLCRKYLFRFDRRGLHACDLDGMMNYRTRLLQIGTTVNEVRRMDDLPPVDGGDVVLVSANLRGINEIGSQPQPESTESKNDEDEK